MKSDGLVTTRIQIATNVERIAEYGKGSSDERKFHDGRIKNGKNFVALQVGSEWLFAPSKFAGYADNDASHMNKLDRRDGGVTNGRLTEILGNPIARGAPEYEQIDRYYEQYASAFGIVPSKHPQGRKYWRL